MFAASADGPPAFTHPDCVTRQCTSRLGFGVGRGHNSRTLWAEKAQPCCGAQDDRTAVRRRPVLLPPAETSLPARFRSSLSVDCAPCSRTNTKLTWHLLLATLDDPSLILTMTDYSTGTPTVFSRASIGCPYPGVDDTKWSKIEQTDTENLAGTWPKDTGADPSQLGNWPELVRTVQEKMRSLPPMPSGGIARGLGRDSRIPVKAGTTRHRL